MAVGESPKVAISSPAQAEAGHQDPRAEVLPWQDGKCALCGGLTGTCELDHVQILQAREDARESAQPRVWRAPALWYARSRKPPLVFEAQTCAKDSAYVGVDVVRCRRNGLSAHPVPGGRR